MEICRQGKLQAEDDPGHHRRHECVQLTDDKRHHDISQGNGDDYEQPRNHTLLYKILHSILEIEETIGPDVS